MRRQNKGDAKKQITASLFAGQRGCLFSVTLLETVRKLQLLGVDAYFERENIHSMSGDGELMLTILASFAREESLSTSENGKWRIHEAVIYFITKLWFVNNNPNSQTLTMYTQTIALNPRTIALYSQTLALPIVREYPHICVPLKPQGFILSIVESRYKICLKTLITTD